MAKDPVCGMEVNIDEAKNKNLVITKNGKTHYFCSKKCKDKFAVNKIKNKVAWYKSDTFSKVFPFFLAAILIVGTITAIAFDFMIFYMGVFFIIFSLFKMPDWKGFVDAFQMYDLIAKFSKPYAWIYPGIELLLGILFIVNFYVEFYLPVIAWITLFIMGIGGIGVTIKLLKREKFQCACLGTWINVPLTKVTLLENILMVIMALVLIF